jgi:hypothetical protein
MRHAVLIVVGMGLALLVSGCIYPHVWSRSPAVTGRILDAETHQPITGATVSWFQESNRMATTDAGGNFSLKSTHGMHWLIISSCAVELPPYHEFRQLTISRSGYNPTTIYASIYAKEKDAPKLSLSDVVLSRQQPEK